MNRWSTSATLGAGLFGAIFGLGGLAAWAVATEINGAVITTGRVEVEAHRQSVQHPDGGLIAEIAVREGETVKAGQALVRLDGTELEARAQLLRHSLIETQARIERLRAEVAGAQTLTFSPQLEAQTSNDAELGQILISEEQLFRSRVETQSRSRAQIDERITQASYQIEGYEMQAAASERQISLIQEELANQTSLYERGLAPFQKVSALSRQLAGLEGDIGRLKSAVAQAKSSRSAFEIETLRSEAEQREEAMRELRDLEPRATELRETLRLTETRLGRLVLRAPMSGRVLDLQTHTVGGVLPAGQDVTTIVPDTSPLVFSVEIDPRQIDRVHPLQTTTLRFPNFSSRTTPTFHGHVRTVSADIVRDPENGRAFYTAQLVLDAESRDALDERKLQPGMPLEAFIQTDARSPASFLLKPLADYFAYAMREE